ncbi:MAG: phage tail sheath C-terminal domain-containing protein, partial [Lawsonibacter sp.]
ALATWVKARRAALIPIRAVLPGHAGDDMGLINFTPCPEAGEISVGSDTFTAAEYCSRIAGILAGIPVACSSTGTVLEEVTAVPPWPDAESAVDAGKLILLHDGISASIARGVNSLVTVPADGAEEWKKIKIVEGLDLITYYLRTTVNTSYKGKYANSYDNKMLLVSAVQTYLEVLEGKGVLEAGSSWVEIDLEAQRDYLKGQGVDVDGLTDQQIREHKTGSWVFLAFGATLLDAMEDFALVGKMS